MAKYCLDDAPRSGQLLAHDRGEGHSGGYFFSNSLYRSRFAKRQVAVFTFTQPGFLQDR